MFDIVRTPFPIYLHTEEEAEEALIKLYEAAEDGRGVGFDTETTGLHVIKDRIRFFSFATEKQRYCAPLRLLPVFKVLLEDPDIPKRMSNAKYDMHMAKNHDVHVRGVTWDSIDMDFLLDENRQGRHGLKPTALDYLGLRMTPFKKVFGDIGSVNDEVRAMVDVHDILELNDHEGKPEDARKLAIAMLLKFKLTNASDVLAKDFLTVDRSIKGGCVKSARQLLLIARRHGLAKKTAGKGGYVSDISEFLGCGPVGKDDRDEWNLEDRDLVEEMHVMLWDQLVDGVTLDKDPVEMLRIRVTDYASLDSWASFMLIDVLAEELDQELMVTEAFLDGEEEPATMLEHTETDRIPFIQTLWNMERRGFKIDVKKTGEYAKDMQKVLDGVEKDIVNITGNLSFNPKSTKDLRAALFEETGDGWVDVFGDKPKKWTSGGTTGIKMPSTDKSVLQRYADRGEPLAKAVLTHRQFRKLKSDYMVGLPTWVDRMQRIHTRINSGGARTWRVSSADPNLQNIPARDPVWGPAIRKLFMAGLWGECDPMLCMEHLRDVPLPKLPYDHPMTLLVADYKQLEMRIMAHFSGDADMIEAIEQGQDLHCKTLVLASAAGAGSVPRGITYEDAVAAKKAKNPTPEQEILVQQRGNLKGTGFGIIYGIGSLKLGGQLGLPIVKKQTRYGRVREVCPEAEALIEDYLHHIYPSVGRFIDTTKQRCREDLVVYTAIGHPRRLPDIISNDRMLSSQAERQCVNSRIQGTAADITNKAMILCESDPVLRRLGVRLLLQIHDELVFELPDDPKTIAAAKARVKELMEDPIPLRVPIEIDMDVAYTWGDAK